MREFEFYHHGTYIGQASADNPEQATERALAAARKLDASTSADDVKAVDTITGIAYYPVD